MEDNWEDVAEYLLRNRRIREMVDEVLNSLDEIDPNCQFRTDESPKHKNQNSHKRKITKPNVIQKERLLKEYRMTKYITEEKKKELAEELNLPQIAIKNWFQNRRRRLLFKEIKRPEKCGERAYAREIMMHLPKFP